MSQPPVDKVQTVFSGRHDRRKVTDWVYEELKAAIINLRLPPGEPLREGVLAEGLGVSKTPVREALTRLEQDGLVTTTSFKGAVVTEYSRADLLDIYELRELLEVAAVREAAASMTEADRERLHRLSLESERLRGEGDTVQLADLITDFDAILFEQVKNPRIRALIANLRAHLTRIGYLTAGIPGRVDASVAQHDEIVRAIANRDVEGADKALRAHIRSVRDEQLQARGDQ